MASRSLFQKNSNAVHPCPTVPTPQHARREVQTGKSTKDVADYIAQMARELAGIAESAQLDLITYFLKMAELEAAETYSRLQDESNSP